MSLFDYEQSKVINREDYPFYALIMAAIRQADTNNMEKLKNAFPYTYAEFFARYKAPGGVLEEEGGFR